MDRADNVFRTGYVNIIVDGKVYKAGSAFNLRNILLGERNALHEAAKDVERNMIKYGDPMLAHITRLGDLP